MKTRTSGTSRRAAKVMRMTIAIGKVPLFVEMGHEQRVNEAGRSQPN